MKMPTEDFVSDDPTLLYSYTTYDTDIHLDEGPPTATQQRQVRFKRKASRKQTALISVNVICPQYQRKVANWLSTNN